MLAQWSTSTGIDDYQYVPAEELLIKTENAENGYLP